SRDALAHCRPGFWFHRDSEFLKSCRNIGRDSDFAFSNLVVVGFQNEPFVYISANAWSRVFDLNCVVPSGIISEVMLRDFAPLGHAQRLLQRKAQCEPSIFTLSETKEVIVTVGVIAKNNAYRFG